MIEQAAIIALVVLFVRATLGPGMIFGRVTPVLDRAVPMPLFRKPLYGCAVCMCVWWGWPITGLTILSGHVLVHTTAEQLFALAMAGGICSVVASRGEAAPCDCDKPKPYKSSANA